MVLSIQMDKFCQIVILAKVTCFKLFDRAHEHDCAYSASVPSVCQHKNCHIWRSTECHHASITSVLEVWENLTSFVFWALEKSHEHYKPHVLLSAMPFSNTQLH